MARIGAQQRFDDRLLGRVVDLGHEVIDLLLRNTYRLHVKRGAVDNGAGGSRSLDGHVDHRVQIGGRHRFLECVAIGLKSGRRLAVRAQSSASMRRRKAAFSHETLSPPALRPRPLRAETIAAMQTRFILINPSHAGNVGAAARAMKVMGFQDLVLVAPRWTNVLRREETLQRASGALDVLASARIVAVGTTTVRALESLPADALTRTDAVNASTDILIAPGFSFRFTDALLTNFHLPRSTLLALVGAFMGMELMRETYATAVRERYRFYSYGDAMLVL